MVTTEALCEASDYMLQGDTEHPWWVLKALCVLTYGLVMKVEKEDL